MDKMVIVAMVSGDATYTYNDGDVHPLHQTLCYMDDENGITAYERQQILDAVTIIAANVSPFTASVIGKGRIGADNDVMVLTESEDLVKLRNLLLADDTIGSVVYRTKQHPTWLSHVSGIDHLKFGDAVLFDRLAIWSTSEVFGEQNAIFPLKKASVFFGEPAVDSPIA